MFKDKLKQDLDNLYPANNVKAKILNKIQQEKPKKVFNFKLTSTIAAALAVVIALGIIIDSRKIVPIQLPEKQVETVKNETKNNTIKTIYNKIKRLSNDEWLYLDDGIVEEYAFNYSSDADDTGNSALKSESVTTKTATKNDFSQTNTREKRVDEEDIIKTDGKFIYRIDNWTDLYIFKAEGENTKKINQLDLLDLDEDFYDDEESDIWANGMFLHNDKLIIVLDSYEKFKTDDCDCKKCKRHYDSFTVIAIFDVSNPKKIKLEKTLKQQGNYEDSRIVNDILYVSSDMYINVWEKKIKEKEKAWYVPSFIDDDSQEFQKDENVWLSSNDADTSYTIFASYDLKANKRIDDKSIFGYASIGYVSENNVYFTEEIYTKHEKTKITRFSLSNGRIENKKEVIILGTLNDTFSIDENGNYLRLVATQNRYSDDSYNSLVILDKNLKEVSSITKLAKGERIYSARFMGDYVYFVTFRETDPLFCADLSDPKNPKILSELKIPGFSDYLHPFGENKLFGFGQSATEKGVTTGVKLSMFDISNKENVLEESNEILKDVYSSANYNYKAIVISQSKNLIAFEAGKYYIYGYDETNGFYEKFSVKISDYLSQYKYYEDSRGLYINNYFYISAREKVLIIDLDTFKVVKTVE